MMKRSIGCKKSRPIPDGFLLLKAVNYCISICAEAQTPGGINLIIGSSWLHLLPDDQLP